MLLTGKTLSAFDVYQIAVRKEDVQLDEAQVENVQKVCDRVQEWGDAQYPIYGVSTGFGELVHVLIPSQYKSDLQSNLLRSHAAGGGEPFPDEIVRAIMAVRLNYLIKGYSGVSSCAVRLIQEFINREIYPIVLQQGSLGASGDLSPLSHMALPLIGDGYVCKNGQRRKSAEVLQEEHLSPLHLGYKEALTLVNGTSAMTGVACIAIVKAYRLLQLALIATADVVQCLRGSTRPFDARGHELKGHTGQMFVAGMLRSLLEDNGLTREHHDIMQILAQQNLQTGQVADTDIYLQDAYSLRCIPQLLGPVFDTLNNCRKIFEEEVNSCNDNPLIFDTPENVFHGGNFHGQYIAMYCDFLNVAIAEIGVVAERQLNRLLDPHLNGKLPPFLAHAKAGLFSGFEGAQYLATSIAAENLDLAAPASIKSIPSNGANQDVVSMGLTSARRSLQLCENVTTIMTVLLAACYQASHFLDAEKFSPPIKQLHRELSATLSLYKDAVPIQEHLASVRDYFVSTRGQEFIEACVRLDKK
jgi:tyrosine 2,3-aminomutase